MNTIIEKIRAEIEQMLHSIENCPFISGELGAREKEMGEVMAYKNILSILSDLEKECEKPTNIDFEQELYKHFGQVKDFTLGMQIGKYFYELGCRRTAEKYDEIEYKRQRADVCDGEEEEEYEQIKQKVCSDCPSHKDDDCGYVKRQLQRKCNYLSDVMYGYELGRQSKPKVSEDVEEEYKDYVESDPVYSKLVNRNAGLSIARHFYELGRQEKPTTAEGLEEEIERYLHSLGVGYGGWVDGMEDDDLRGIARHFAQWGAEHLRDTTKKVSEDLEEAAKQFVGYDMDTDDLRDYEIGVSSFKAGAKWQEEQDLKYISEIHRNGYNLCKEQMMREAVEGAVVKDISNKLAVTAKINLDGFKFGDKVRVIVCKKED